MRKLILICLISTGTAHAENVTETFRFTTDYYFLNLKGVVGQRQQIMGVYTRDLTARMVKWTDVTVANSKGSSDSFGTKERSTSMEGFTYVLGAADTTKPEFFRDLTSITMQEQNLVWDTRMFEIFAEDVFADVRAKTEYHLPREIIPLAGAGTFQNEDPRLTWTGTSHCSDREECAVIDYRAFFNTFELRIPKETLNGRSHYWGQVWVSLSTKRIVRATLYEDVLGEVVPEGLGKPQPVNVFRIGLFERVKE
jgi:hypothetical protein